MVTVLSTRSVWSGFGRQNVRTKGVVDNSVTEGKNGEVQDQKLNE